MVARLSKLLVVASASMLSVSPAKAATFFFSTGNVDGRLATASRPDGGGKTEIETADDFVLAEDTTLTSGTFTGLINNGRTGSIGDVIVEIYRVFPLDSTTPPSTTVPTRTNSPSDVALQSFSAAASQLAFTTTLVASSFTASNSVINGINPVPNQRTGGEGAVSGSEVTFGFTFATPLDLAAGHYFFVPQVQVSGGEFLWLSAVRPIVPPGTPFAPDLQSWIRNQNLDPNWLRVGTDIVGGTTPPTFNAAFTLNGVTATAVPEPATWATMILGFGLSGAAIRRRRRSPALAAAG